MKKVFIFLFIAYTTYSFGQFKNNTPQITNVDFSYNGEFIMISYEITRCVDNDMFYVWFEPMSSKGRKLEPKSIAGDLQNVSCGKHQISWNIKKDGLAFDENLQIKINATQISSVATSKAIMYSLAFPGLGQNKITNSKKYTWIGILGYGLLGGALTNGILSLSNIAKYKNADASSKADALYKTINTQRNASLGLGIGAALVWSIDIGRTIVKSKKTKNLTPQKIQALPASSILAAQSESKPINTSLTQYVRDNLPPNLFAELNFSDENGNGILEADEKAKLIVKISNQGKGKAQGLKIKIVDDLKDLALNIGNIDELRFLEPEETKTIEIPISTKHEIKTAQHRFEISVSEYFGYDMDNAYLVLNTYEYQIPKITFSGLEIFDSGENTMAIIQDDKIQPGEQVRVKMIIQNTGQGMARNVKFDVNTTNQYIFLSDNGGAIGNISPGQIKEIWFSLSPNKRVTSTEQLPVFLSLSEELNGSQIKEMQLPITMNAKPPKTEIVTVKSDFESLKKNIAKFEYTSSKFTAKVGNVEDIHAYPKSKTIRKNSVAVVIGVEQYKELPPAPYANNDAEIIKEYFKKVLGVEQVVSYTDDKVSGFFFDDIFNPDNGELQKAIVKGESDVFVFYSGHGVPDKSGENIYLFPSDGKVSRIEAQGYNINKLYENLNKLGAKSVTVFIDACFSGSSKTSETYKAENLVAMKGIKINPKIAQPWIINNNFSVFNSSSNSETSLGFDAASTGLFTYFLCVGMQGKADINNDKKITLGELKKYVIENVTTTSKKISGLQTPEFHGSEDLILFEY